MTALTPASEKLLREIARHDKGAGVPIRYLSRGRYTVDRSSTAFNRASFLPLFDAELVTGWDEHDDDGPMRITDAGRQLLAELDANAKLKKPRPKPSADGATAQRLLREIAKRDEPALIHSDGRRRIWHLGAHDGYRASVDTWMSLCGAGLIQIERVGSIGGQHVSVTDAGRQRLAR